MIIFGLRSGSFKPVAVPAASCGYCHSTGTVHLYFARRYFHIFWIPIFPAGKTGMSECSHCKQSLRQVQMSPTLQNSYTAASRQVKTSPKYFAGLILIGLFAGAATIAAFIGRSNSEAYIQSPKAGDIYEINENGVYTLYRVQAVTADSVSLNPHEYEATSRKKFRALKRDYPDSYANEAFSLSKQSLSAMFGERRISHVNRK